MSNYSINDLELLTGIKAHTIRIWEQRYQLIKPERSLTNIRNYNADDLKLLLNVALLRDHGYKISKIAQFSNQQIHNEVIGISDLKNSYTDQIQVLTTSMLDLDEMRFEKIVNENVKKHGFENVMIHIIYPFLSKIGTLWTTGSLGPVQEHFMSNLIRQKIVRAIDELDKTLKPNYLTFILYLPEGEYHEIGLLFAHYIIKSRQHKVVYLGQSLPQADLEYVCKFHKPQYIFTAITSCPGHETIQNYIDWLGVKFLDLKILVTGYQTMNKDLNLGKNTTKIAKIDDLLAIID
jgi:MerR family transcriptional regulator, light-induced transcriptional regulator